MKKLVACLLLATTLAACGSEPTPEPTPSASATPTPEPSPSLPAPDEETFAAVFAEACPNAAKVGDAFCKSEGFGKPGFFCDYTLGSETRHKMARLTPGEDKWLLDEPEKTCTA